MTDFPAEGGCDCGTVRYRLHSEPMFVNCCHCRWCQRETGSAFVINAMIESDRVELLEGQPDIVDTPSASGKGQRIARCQDCKVALWSHYAGAGAMLSFIRVGTLDNPDLLPPQAQVFTESRQRWVVLSPEIPAFERYYKPSEMWPAESLARYQAMQQAAAETE